MRTKFKVSELHHAFMNGVAVAGATAGENARVINARLHHDSQTVAASFLQDAVSADGRRVVCIAPQYQDNASRWTVADVTRAVPDTLAIVAVKHWAQVPGYSYAYAESAESAQALVALFLAAIDRNCKNAIHSVDDTEGTKPDHVPGYAGSVAALLALVWTDTVSQHDARLAWNAMRDKWQLSDAGEFALSLVRSIAQRAAIMDDAAEALPKLREYFTRRANIKTLQERLELVDKYSRTTLELAMTAVFRAGVPAMDTFPQNMNAIIASDFARCDRAYITRQAPRKIKEAWQSALEGHRVYGYSLPTNLPVRFKNELETIATFSRRKYERRGNVADVAEFAEAQETAEFSRQILAPILASMTSPAFDMLTCAAVASDNCNKILTFIDRYESRAYRLNQITPGHPATQTPAGIWWANEENRTEATAQYTALRATFNAALQEVKRRENIAGVRDGIAQALQLLATMPRFAYGKLCDLRGKLNGWNNAETYGENRPLVFAEVLEAIETAVDARENVSESDEWQNGGNAPESGDWLRVSGERCKTSRGVEVATRGIRLALKWLDSQPDGACVAPAAFDISGYILKGRDARGNVTVGCHVFHAESVANIRQQLQGVAA